MTSRLPFSTRSPLFVIDLYVLYVEFDWHDVKRINENCQVSNLERKTHYNM